MGNEYWALDSRDGLKCTFYGLSTDIASLPTDAEIGTGSVAYCVDTGDVYMFYQPTTSWHEQ